MPDFLARTGTGPFQKKGAFFAIVSRPVPPHTASWSIEKQIELYIRDHPQKKYIAYFQSHCNTYGPIRELKRKYESVFRYDDIVGLFIGTRPDAISLPALALLKTLSRRIYLTVELGLQSIHEQSLLFLNRNHTYGQFLKTFHELEITGNRNRRSSHRRHSRGNTRANAPDHSGDEPLKTRRDQIALVAHLEGHGAVRSLYKIAIPFAWPGRIF